jgi:hypothetical protein
MTSFLYKNTFTFFLLITFGSSAFAAKTPEEMYEQRPVKLTYSNVVSLQPAIISDAECAEAFSEATLPAYEAEHHSKKMSIEKRDLNYKVINAKLTALFLSNETTIHRQNKESLKTPKLSSLQMNNDTLTGDGSFFTYYCSGNVHRENL